MALPNNVLQQVATYQESSLAYLQNQNCFIEIANKKFKDFNQLEANLGASVTFDTPPRYTSADSLQAVFQTSTQLVETLTCSQSANTAFAFSAEQFIFNAEDYMEKFGKSAVMELATRVERDVAKNANSSVRSGLTGLFYTNSGPFRFYGNGINPINSYQQLAQMAANYKDFGSPQNDLKVILPLTAVPAIIGTGLNQFAPERNNDAAMSWELGTWGGVTYYTSNLLPIQEAGNVGNNGTTLTLVSTNDPTGANITQMVFSGASANDANAVKAGDLFQFQDGVSGKPNLRFLTYIGHAPCDQPVQFRATADAAADGSGNVTVNVSYALVSAPTAAQNLNNPLSAGMQVKALPSHRCGLMMGGSPLFLAMPKLPDQPPFPTANKADPATGVAMRTYYGSLFGQNQQGFVYDCLWGSHLVQQYCMRMAFPL